MCQKIVGQRVWRKITNRIDAINGAVFLEKRIDYRAGVQILHNVHKKSLYIKCKNALLIFDFMNFMLSIIKFTKFKPRIKCKKLELHISAALDV